MAQERLLEPWTNQNLFSQTYLEDQLPGTALWREARPAAERALAAIERAFDETRELAPGPGEEQALEHRLIRPVLEALGFEFDVQPRGWRGRRPDYVLFASARTLQDARRAREDGRLYYRDALAIAEAKYWGRPLGGADPQDALFSRDPTAQVIRYLDDAHYLSGNAVNWAVLTNGRTWRLLSYRTASPATDYYEVDLDAITRAADVEAFMHFYLFFARDALAVDPATNRSWLDLHLEGSRDYATRVSTRLKRLIFDDVFERLADGFIAYRRRDLGIGDESDETLREVFNGCLTLLYRLLFLLYAESRKLLPVDDTPRYYQESLSRLKRDIWQRLTAAGPQAIHAGTFAYWERLSGLFRIVNEGSRDLNVPRYNGNLFRTGRDDFLATHRLGDRYLAEAIRALTVDDAEAGVERYFDYSSLGVRHLGDIYEGLLEFRVRIAAEEIVEVRDGRRAAWTPARAYGKARVLDRRRPGQVYIENSRHERRATGSYFTPHSIVEYMVRDTVGRAVQERLDETRRHLEAWQALRAQRRRARAAGTIRELDRQAQDTAGRAFDALFSLRVLDPAMGSGHFLVAAVDEITTRIMAFFGGFPENPISEAIDSMRDAILHDVGAQGVRLSEDDLARLAEPNLVKRMVMKRCVFGVDLNPMAVELAKLSLWLHSFTIGAPLSFLDHHLRSGNSLIGVTFEEVQHGASEAPQRGAAGAQVVLFRGPSAGLLLAAQTMLDVAALTDVTWRERLESERLYGAAEDALLPYRRALHLWTAEAFGVVGARAVLTHAGADEVRLRSPKLLQPHDRALLDAAEAEAREHAFFHWEVEFPEAYYERGRRRERAGFDVVIGNPPYVRIQGMDDQGQLTWLRSSIDGGAPRYISVFRNFDVYVPFIERGFSLCHGGGRFCFIVPNKFFQAEYAERLRGLVTARSALTQIVDFGDNQIFEESEVTNYTCLLFLAGEPQTEVRYIEILPLEDVGVELPRVLRTLAETQVHSGTFALSELGPEPWCFPLGVAREIRKKAEALSDRLIDVVEDIAVGIQTSADDVYILDYVAPGSRPHLLRVRSRSLDREVELEQDPLKQLVSGEDAARYGTPTPSSLLLFPYRLTSEGAELIPPRDFQRQSRRTWEYLRENEERLRAREDRRFDNDQWYRFGRHQNLDRQEFVKAGVPRLVDRLKAFYDPEGRFYLDNVDVNGVLFRDNRPEDHRYIVALLNSRLLDMLFKQCSVRFQNRFYSANKQFIAPLPIRRIPFVTPERERRTLIAEGQRVAADTARTGDSDPLLEWLEARLSPRHAPDGARAATYAEDATWANWPGREGDRWEQADVVHDLLARLAEQMITLKRGVDDERKGFLNWVDRAIGGALSRLSGRERLAAYDTLSEADALAILRAGRRRVQADVTGRAFTESFSREFAASRARLDPLKAEFEVTDRIIDHIVYRLYGLTPQEVEAVELR